MLQQGTEQRHKVFAGSQIFLQAHPGTWPAVQIPAVVFDSMERRGGSAVYFSVLAVTCFHFMLQLITILPRRKNLWVTGAANVRRQVYRSKPRMWEVPWWQV